MLCDPMIVECDLQESWHEFVVDSLRWFAQKQLGVLAEKERNRLERKGSWRMRVRRLEMWRRVAADPNRMVPEPVQKEKEEIYLNLIAFFPFFFIGKITPHDSSKPNRVSIREKGATKMQ